MNALNYPGRPHGLGNRIEEIIRLEALGDRWNSSINYIWRNPGRRSRWRRLMRRRTIVEGRTYPILLRAGRVALLPEEIGEILGTLPNNLPPFNEIDAPFDPAELQICATRIKPVFDIRFPAGTQPVGVHLRGTDRINPQTTHDHFLRSKEEFTTLLEQTAATVNAERPERLFICGDSASALRLFRQMLDSNITIVQPIYSAKVPSEYRDFFSLSACSRIYLASKFSSFSLTAALIGGRPIHMANPSAEVQARYGLTIEAFS